MKLTGAPIALLLALVPAAAIAQSVVPRVSVALGETVTVRLADNGGFIELSRGPVADAPAPRADDTIRFTLTRTGPMTMLNAENGYAQGLAYRARIFNGGRSADTSICTVMPRIASYESWPDRVDRVELREPRLVQAAGISCQ
jgi:hypothetical protein